MFLGHKAWDKITAAAVATAVVTIAAAAAATATATATAAATDYIQNKEVTKQWYGWVWRSFGGLMKKTTTSNRQFNKLSFFPTTSNKKTS